MAAGSNPNRLCTQPAQPVFVAGTRVCIQAIPENPRPRVVVPTSAGTQPPAHQCVVARPLDRQGFATNSPSPSPQLAKYCYRVKIIPPTRKREAVTRDLRQ